MDKSKVDHLYETQFYVTTNTPFPSDFDSSLKSQNLEDRNKLGLIIANDLSSHLVETQVPSIPLALATDILLAVTGQLDFPKKSDVGYSESLGHLNTWAKKQTSSPPELIPVFTSFLHNPQALKNLKDPEAIRYYGAILTACQKQINDALTNFFDF